MRYVYLTIFLTLFSALTVATIKVKAIGAASNDFDGTKSGLNKIEFDERCFIDGTLVPRCFDKFGWSGVSWPVFTADTPREVMRESDRIWARDNFTSVELGRADKPIKVANVDMGEYDFDVLCFVFKSGAKTCFDPLEISER